tara:strand:+ start:7713 stop:8780 length:1068 start_codon:yes stop_codon:yes gene_type:complete
MKKSLICAGLALSMGMGAQTALAKGIQIDFGGGGSISGSDLFTTVGWLPGNMLVHESIEVNDLTMMDDRTMYAQGHAFVDGADPSKGVFTYQIILPITPANVAGGGAITLSDRDMSSSIFAMFWDSDPTGWTRAGSTADPAPTNVKSGDGYGSLDDATLEGTQVELIRGTIDIVDVDGFGDPRPWEVRQTDSAITRLAYNTPGIGTTSLTSQTTLQIDIMSQDDSYVVNNMVSTGFAFDLNLVNFNAQTPYEENAGGSLFAEAASAKVVGNVPDYGDPQFVTSGAFGGGDTVPVNDLTCFASGFGATSSPCDIQLQLTATSNFNGEPVPEPTTLALIGLGLAAAGFASAKRRRRT